MLHLRKCRRWFPCKSSSKWRLSSPSWSLRALPISQWNWRAHLHKRKCPRLSAKICTRQWISGTIWSKTYKSPLTSTSRRFRWASARRTTNHSKTCSYTSTQAVNRKLNPWCLEVSLHHPSAPWAIYVASMTNNLSVLLLIETIKEDTKDLLDKYS